MPLPEHLEGKTLKDNPQNINRDGRPKGSRNRSTIVREAIEAILEGSSQTIVDAMTSAIILKAMAGDVMAYRELLDSAFGKNTDKQLISGDPDNPLETNLSVKFID